MAHNRTELGGTATTEGFIPHREVPIGDMGVVFFAPVKIEVNTDGRPATGRPYGDTNLAPTPQRRHGGFVYALPGGADYIPSKENP
jgi:hypothetical protein